MQQEQPTVCRCGYENPGNFCPDCGARQPGRGEIPGLHRVPVESATTNRQAGPAGARSSAGYAGTKPPADHASCAGYAGSVGKSPGRTPPT